MSEGLKPCPFCGGRAEIEQQGTNRVSNIYSCLDCGATLETGETWQAPQDWNNRPREAELLATIKELRGALEGMILEFYYDNGNIESLKKAKYIFNKTKDIK